jgi:2-desacetyl-2-hydroxyethyl bacteriochlorophyllide A dehydrogenase
MKALILQKPGNFEITELPKCRPPKAGEALVKIHKIGICGTDIHAYAGRQPFFNYPRRLGHELGAEVLAVGDNVHNIRPGHKVAIEPYLTCGYCQACAVGKTNCCESLLCLGVHTDGGMVEQLILPANKLHKSDLLSYEQLALVETLGIGCHAVNRAAVLQNELALVIGAGPIGLSVLQFLKERSSNIVLMDSNPLRLAFAQQHLGITHTVLAQNPDNTAAIKTTFEGKLPTVVFDATGSQTSMQQAFQYVGHGGKLVYVGLVQGDICFSDPHLHRREISLLASRNAVAADFEYIIDAIELGRINTQPWITHRCAIDVLPHVFERWLEPNSGLVKGMVNF